MEEEVKFIGASPSPFNSRVEIALKLKGIKYEFIKEDLLNKSDLLLQSNPVHKKIPVLVHGGKPISESMIILEYIDETWPEINPLRPNDPYERSVARFWTKFVEEKSLCMWLLFGGKGQEKAKEDCYNMLKTLEEQSNIRENAFFGGENIGLTDIAFGVLAYWLEIIEHIAKLKIFDAETFPSLHSWKQKFLEVPVIKESLPNRDELTVFLDARKDWIIAKAESLQVSARS
ncbi:hypothetical protein MKW92_029460 [Papaver armeniacum]|nr:hypothetical protein MKW92_029460 [Papaver armeniacum]